GKVRLDVKPVMVTPIIHSALDAVRPAAEAKSIQLDVTIDPAAEHLRVDSARLQQVIWNLLSNSIKFTPANGKVTVRVKRVASEAEISVSDTGEGINPEFLP
ncbi:MAG TPA: HAMP domain-containing sensor histidine kinase, partial [Pyrinomonadaceae bacterium]|nr:HAMP domain-containing sensor histidine kinase [Pyrinomonadaceae bacterium]